MRQKSAMLGTAAAAAVSRASFAAVLMPCAAGGLSTYLSGSNRTCTVLDKTISGVSFSNSASLPASDWFVIPVLTPNDPGLTFIFNEPVQTLTGSISYTVTAPSSDPMTDASLALFGTAPPGSFADLETLSNGKSLSASDSTPNPPDVTFAPTTSLTVTDAFSQTSPGGLARLTNQFSETPAAVPEPSSLALLSVGLSALGLVRRRKRS